MDYPKKIKIVDETIPIDDVSGGGYRMIIRKYEIPDKGSLFIKFNDDKKTVKYIETHIKESEKPVIIKPYEILLLIFIIAKIQILSNFIESL